MTSTHTSSIRVTLAQTLAEVRFDTTHRLYDAVAFVTKPRTPADHRVDGRNASSSVAEDELPCSRMATGYITGSAR